MLIYVKAGFVSLSEKEVITARNSGQQYDKRMLVLKDDSQNYENMYAIEIFGNANASFEGVEFEEGETIDIQCAINCREYNGNWYTKLSATGNVSFPDRSRQARKENEEEHRKIDFESAIKTPDPLTAENNSKNNSNEIDDLPF